MTAPGESKRSFMLLPYLASAFLHSAVRLAGECACISAGVQESNVSKGEELRGQRLDLQSREEKRKEAHRQKVRCLHEALQ